MINKKQHTIILLVLFVMLYHKVQCQTSSNINISAKYARGYIYPHHESFKYFIKDYTSALELNLSKKVSGEKLWHQLYRNPTVGLGYYYVDLGNKEQLGHANAIFPYISVPIVRWKYVSISSKYAAGVAWLSKRFDLIENKYNIAIGSNLNAYLNLNLDIDIRLTKRVYFQTGIGLTHFSNGGTQQPNKGFNIFAFQTGVRLKLSDNERDTGFMVLPKLERKNEYSVIYAGGVKTLEPARTKKYYVSTLSINAERQVSYKSRLGVGIDIFKDNSRKEYLIGEDIENPAGMDLFYAGGHFSYDLVFGKTSFTVQMGAYFWQKSKSYESVYHRFGLKYRFSKHWMANLTLKTFWAAADFAEWGIGYRF
jgi:hypothetical protein